MQNDSFLDEAHGNIIHQVSRDTVWYSIEPFVLSDIYEMPKKGVQIDYIKGRFQITGTGGHVH